MNFMLRKSYNFPFPSTLSLPFLYASWETITLSESNESAVGTQQQVASQRPDICCSSGA